MAITPADCQPAGKPTPLGDGWVSYPFFSPDDDPTTKLRLEAKKVKMGSPLPRNIRNLSFDLKGMITRHEIGDFYIEQAGKEIVVVVKYIAPHTSKEQIKASARAVALLIRRYSSE